MSGIIVSRAPQGVSGQVAPTGRGWFMSATTMTANRAYVVRFVPSKNMSVVKIGYVTTLAATNDDACDVGIYSSDLATKMVSAGATSGKMNATAGQATITITATGLTAGVTYYLAFSYGTAGGTAAKLLTADYNAIALGPALLGNTAGLRDILTKATSHPLPSSLAAGTDATTTQAPILVPLES